MAQTAPAVAAQSAALTTVITDMAAEKTMYMAYLTTTVAKRLEVEPHYSNDLEVWRNLKTEGKVQRASQKARVLLAIQATQIASERVFNRVKAITGTPSPEREPACTRLASSASSSRQ